MQTREVCGERSDQGRRDPRRAVPGEGAGGEGGAEGREEGADAVRGRARVSALILVRMFQSHEIVFDGND